MPSKGKYIISVPVKECNNPGSLIILKVIQRFKKSLLVETLVSTFSYRPTGTRYNLTSAQPNSYWNIYIADTFEDVVGFML